MVVRRAIVPEHAGEKKVFQESKDKVLQTISHLVGADITELKESA